MTFPLGVVLECGAVRPVDALSMHSHPHCELFFLLSGHRRYFVGHTIYQVEPGDLVIIPPTQLHRTTQTDATDYKRYLLNFYAQDHSSFIRSIGQDTFDSLISSGCICFPPSVARHVRQTLEQLERELAAPSAYAKPVISHLLQDILLQALCHGQKKEPYHGESADKVQQVARYISRHYDQPITLADAAAMATMESTYFSKRFKALTGFGFYRYLTHTRLQAAEGLLEDTDLSIGEIAERCGFSEANHFGNVFRRWNGVSPSQYRKLPNKTKEKLL